MTCRYLTLFLLFASCFLTASAQTNIQVHTTKDAFSAAAGDVTVHDFEGIVPNSGFKHYQREGVLRYSGLEFRPGGGARFGPGPVIVVGGYYQGGPAYETTTGAKLHWAPPNQPGNAFIEIALPAGTTAVGTDVWTVQPLQSSIEVTVTTSDGKSRTETIATPARPGAAFVGFTSDSSITSLRFTPPKGQTGLIIDNFTIGKSRGLSEKDPGVKPAPAIGQLPVDDGPARDRAAKKPSATAKVPAPPPERSTDMAEGPVGSGLIAYVRGGTEIRTVNADGSGDRRLWTHADLSPQLGIYEMSWKPDGTELAFSSAHEATSSPYMADIYTIKRDGTAPRRLTNPPERGGLGRFPKGSVTVNVSNFLSAGDSPGSIIVYVVGADEPQEVFIPAHGSKVVTFKSVADFGRQAQMLVAMSGNRRWIVPGVDVVPGRTVTAPALPVSGPGLETHGAFRPVWSSDGSRITFRSGLCLVSSAPATPVPGSSAFNPFFSGKNPLGACTWDWGRTSATANQVIYSENSAGSNIYQMTAGGAHPGTKLTAYSDLDYQLLMDLHWIPDGSGLLYSTVNLYRDSSNIFRYDFATKKTTQVTKLEKAFAREFSVSPDSRSVVFQHCPDREAEAGCDLWTIGIDGGGARLLVKDGLRPAWSS